MKIAFVVALAACVTAALALPLGESDKTCAEGSACTTTTTALVVGAAGNVGRGAATALLKLSGDRAISTLFVVSRSADSLAALHRDYLGGDPRVVSLVADVTTAAGAAELAALVKENSHGKAAEALLDHVVVSSGPWWTVPPLHELDPLTCVRACVRGARVRSSSK